MKVTATHTPNTTVSGRPATPSGSMSTAEIKARIETMFADDSAPAHPAPTPTPPDRARTSP